MSLSTPKSWKSLAVESSLEELKLTLVGGIERKAEILSELRKKLDEIQGYEDYDPRSLKSIVLKRNYDVVDTLVEHSGKVRCLQALPDGRIVSGSYDGILRVWSKDEVGVWQSEELAGHTDWVNCLQALPDGRIVSGSDDQTLKIWDSKELVGGVL